MHRRIEIDPSQPVIFSAVSFRLNWQF